MESEGFIDYAGCEAEESGDIFAARIKMRPRWQSRRSTRDVLFKAREMGCLCSIKAGRSRRGFSVVDNIVGDAFIRNKHYAPPKRLRRGMTGAIVFKAISAGDGFHLQQRESVLDNM